MAIKNASDLLVYAKTTAPAKQVTRIYVKTIGPLEIPDGATQGNVKINNITNGSGFVKDDVTTNNANNTASSLISQLSIALVTDNNYTQSAANVVSGDYTYRDFTNGANGIVPTLQIVSGTGTINEDAIIIEVLTPGSSAIFDPVAFSTSASLSVNRDLRDVTNKDSNGWSESQPGLKSFEMSTDSLQSINPDTPLDGSDFFDKLKTGNTVNLSFSDRIRNIIRTNLVQIGVDNFTANGTASQDNSQADPFGGFTASKIITGSGQTAARLQYAANAGQLANKKITWSFYVKGTTGTGAKTECKFQIFRLVGGTPTTFPAGSLTWSILEGDGTLSTTAPTNSTVSITGLSTSSWTRIQGYVSTEAIDAGPVETFNFYLYPSASATATNDSIFTSSWQIEFRDGATNYQDPTDITHWQGNALVSSINFDAGVEDNYVCSATFTGTDNIYPNGLGPELIGDTSFDNGTNWWTIYNQAGTSSVIENGYAKLITTSNTTNINKSALLIVGDYYSLTYTVHTNSQGGLGIFQLGGTPTTIDIPSTAGQTYTIEFKAYHANFVLTSVGATTIWLSSISLKKVL